MAIRHASVRDYIFQSYEYVSDKKAIFGRRLVYKDFKWSDTFLKHQSLEDTYIIIFGPDQDKYLKEFMKLCEKDKVNVLFKSEKAMNYNYNNDDPRNTLVIFELEQLLQV